jgi:glycosyltransferase involved in cell wall biosynthesis
MDSATSFTKLGESEKRPYRMDKPFVSVVVPAYNEAAVLEKNLRMLCDHMKSLESEYRWEIIVVNDGSNDGTGEIAENVAKVHPNVFVLHHIVNLRLGNALRYAFNNCRGDYVVTMDIDLSYSPDHIDRLLKTIKENRAKIVIASPYMRGGKVSNVPWLRRFLSIWANRYLSLTAPGNLSTLTGMVRGYDAKFLRTLDLKASDTEINEEIIYKAQMLGARIVEIPAHLDWSFRKTIGKKRRVSLQIFKKIISCLFSGFIFRPFMFFIIPGMALILLSLYPIGWAFIHTLNYYQQFSASHPTISSGHLLSAAVAEAFRLSPHSFLVGGFTVMLAFQLVSLGVLALQNKRYFEEMFHLGTTIYKFNRENGRDS